MNVPYTVTAGDTLFRIARRQGVSGISLYCANPQLREHMYVYPGQIIQIPAAPARLYIVQPGDTFYDIARRLCMALEDLTAANPDMDPRRLQTGQTIKLSHVFGPCVVDTGTEYGYSELIQDIRLLHQRYPFLRVDSIGCSALGRAIPVIRLGGGRKEIHFNGSFHANEWITSLLLMKFVEQYAESYVQKRLLRGRNMEPLFEQTSLWIVPMVNPDGVELVHCGAVEDKSYSDKLIDWNNGSLDFSGWKANIRGVDLNDQFPACWEQERDRREATGPGPRDYTGPHPLSEPEAKAMADFTCAHDFRLVIALHTQGQEIYWNYRDLEPAESESIARRFAKVSRYRAVKLKESDAGYKDWFIGQFRRPGFTVEAGFGVNPLPLLQFRAMYDEVIGIMLDALVI
jgi:g-D-glutamyl-meso-diaminopimelate peptidase